MVSRSSRVISIAPADVVVLPSFRTGGQANGSGAAVVEMYQARWPWKLRIPPEPEKLKAAEAMLGQISLNKSAISMATSFYVPVCSY